MKAPIMRLKRTFFIFILMLMSSRLSAGGLPTPNANDMPSGSNDWLDVGGNMLYKGLGIGCIVMGVSTLLTVVYISIRAYQVAHEKQDLGHFFKTLFVGLIAAALGLGLLYVGNSIIPTNSN